MNKDKILLIVFSISLLLFLLLFSYKTTLFFTDLNEGQQEVVNFVQNHGELKGNFTINEVSHLEDVQDVLVGVDYAFYFLLLVVTLIITYHRKKKEELGKLFGFGGKVVVVSLGVILLLSLLNFDFVFELFHNIFFPQGNWTFPIESLLIQTFPLEFFMKISRNILLQTLLWGSFFILISLFKILRTKQIK